MYFLNLSIIKIFIEVSEKVFFWYMIKKFYFQFVTAHHMDPFDQTVNKWVENAYANLEFLVTSATHAQTEPALH